MSTRKHKILARTISEADAAAEKAFKKAKKDNPGMADRTQRALVQQQLQGVFRCDRSKYNKQNSVTHWAQYDHPGLFVLTFFMRVLLEVLGAAAKTAECELHFKINDRLDGKRFFLSGISC